MRQTVGIKNKTAHVDSDRTSCEWMSGVDEIAKLDFHNLYFPNQGRFDSTAPSSVILNYLDILLLSQLNRTDVRNVK